MTVYLHFLGCTSCGTYDRHNHVAQVALAYLRNELKFTGSTSSVDSNFVGHSADGKSKHTDGQVWGSLSWPRRLAIDVSVVNRTQLQSATRVPVHVVNPFSTRTQGPELQRR
jgi:hypothetical protein